MCRTSKKVSRASRSTGTQMSSTWSSRTSTLRVRTICGKSSWLSHRRRKLRGRNRTQMNSALRESHTIWLCGYERFEQSPPSCATSLYIRGREKERGSSVFRMPGLHRSPGGVSTQGNGPIHRPFACIRTGWVVLLACGVCNGCIWLATARLLSCTYRYRLKPMRVGPW